eukprot:scaffold4890_cov136-Isochrysis_galbana.AAC.3
MPLLPPQGPEANLDRAGRKAVNPEIARESVAQVCPRFPPMPPGRTLCVRACAPPWPPAPPEPGAR